MLLLSEYKTNLKPSKFKVKKFKFLSNLIQSNLSSVLGLLGVTAL